MKVKPVMDALEAAGVETVLVHSGQHYDPGMSDVFFTDLGLRPPDHYLGVGSGSQAEQTARVMMAFEPLVTELAPEVVVVLGDVNSTMACALVAAKTGSLVAHVEAGLRSGDWSMPEEVNRVVTDRVSDYLFAPSRDAVEHLRSEGYRPNRVHLVGNVMVDTLLANLERAKAQPILGRLGLSPGNYGVVTLHRPSNVDDPTALSRIVTALGQIACDLPLVFPAHPRTRQRLSEIDVAAGLMVLEPAGYLDFIALEASAAVVLTDSGGVQEETTMLGVPCLTLRENTERPITIAEGTNRLVGLDPTRIVQDTLEVLRNPPKPRRPELWDGEAARRIADVIVSGGGRSERVRPTGTSAESSTETSNS